MKPSRWVILGFMLLLPNACGVGLLRPVELSVVHCPLGASCQSTARTRAVSVHVALKTWLPRGRKDLDSSLYFSQRILTAGNSGLVPQELHRIPSLPTDERVFFYDRVVSLFTLFQNRCLSLCLCSCSRIDRVWMYGSYRRHPSVDFSDLDFSL